MDDKTQNVTACTQYRPEMWEVEKDSIYAAEHALKIALQHMQSIKVDNPRFQDALRDDCAAVEKAIRLLRIEGEKQRRGGRSNG
jgi:hypothetical protein